MVRINSEFQIFGYPGIAMLFAFWLHWAGAVWLILGILWKDYQDKRKTKEVDRISLKFLKRKNKI